ncbi:cobalamin biosynthesis protein CbiD [Lactonifactor longoviformis]|uniref:Cobalt-precorrin-5B C(1)-methyltransferase n=1 Tax=Lactonifactor longoviformis DSM 17459 TaxID=1122155 RepID=A0A1M5AH28_9CLOT|nr:cobalt-precorrin-5B (C(1))-methyltransferase CbiD [Lactonifactor longoviformis]POP34492.1 cobalamin biosynthesis protein CbiD [Lactonifactor longoviformis]SHF29436.1 cobalt-precorrin 5B C1-methyltransferase [Lactonifactor longoviformis DSM 17459]
MEHKNGLEDFYIVKNNKKMRYGYTTGSCAAAAAKGAARMLLSQEQVEEADLMTPKGILLHLLLMDIRWNKEKAECCVQKYAGDDPDATDGMHIYATVEKRREPGVVIDGGIGVGRITRKGLEQPVGAAAINRVPRRMIAREVEQVIEEENYEGGLKVTIWTPEGEKIGKRTFNPRLGIQGGISILGTSGIVEPMSEAALIKSIEIEMHMRVENGGRYLLVTPGNYGAAYLKEHMELDFSQNIKCSNYVGETIDMAIGMEAKGILFISHIGKFIKVAAGIMNTHSRSADGRAEIMAANAVRAGASLEMAKELLQTGTTDEALGILQREGLVEKTMEEVLERVEYYLNHRAYGQLETGAILFSNTYGYLGNTSRVPDLLDKLREQQNIT